MTTDSQRKDEPTYSIVVRDRNGFERTAAFYTEARRDRFGARIEAEGGRVIHKGMQD